MPQFARPASDATLGGWLDEAAGSTDIYLSIDEAAAADADYVESPANPDPATQFYEAGLSSVTDPGVGTGHVARYRYAKSASAGRQIDLQVHLYQSTTLIASGTAHADISDAWTDGSFTLSGAEADAITDYGALELRLTADAVGGGGGRRCRVSWAELEIPDLTVTPKAGSDTLGAAAVDATPVLLGLLAPAETLAASLTETPGLLASLARADAAGLAADGVSTLLGLVERMDTADLAAAGASALIVAMAAAETLGVSAAGTLGTIEVTLSRSDAGDLGLAGALAILARVNRADSAAAALAEAVDLAAVLAAGDALDPALAEAPGDLLIALDRADALDLTAAGGAAILARLACGDLAALGMTDSSQVEVMIQAADVAEAALDEAAAEILAALGRADALDLSIAEVSALFAQLLTGDTLDTDTAEVRALRALIATAEALDLTVSEGVTLDQVSVALAIALLAISHRAGTGVAISHRAGTNLAISHRRAA